MNPPPQPFPCRFSNMVISGGAVKTLSSIGCIRYLEEIDILKYAINFLGTSAGSIMCLFLVLGFSSKEMSSFIIKQFREDSITQLDIEEALMIFERYGISSGANLERFVHTMISTKLGKPDITFLELAKISGKNLVVCVANISDEREEFWSVDTVPNMSVAFAIRTSCSLPLIFTPIRYKDKWYVDGGLYNNFPIDYFQTDVLRDIIGVNILSKSNPKKEVTDFFSYIHKVLGIALKQLSKPYKDDLKNNVVTLELYDEAWISLTNMKLSIPKNCLEMNVAAGYEQMKQKLQIHCEKMADLTTTTLQTQ